MTDQNAAETVTILDAIDEAWFLQDENLARELEGTLRERMNPIILHYQQGLMTSKELLGKLMEQALSQVSAD